MKSKLIELERAKRIEKTYITKIRFCKNDLERRDFTKWDIVTLRNISSTGLLFNYDKRIMISSEMAFKIMMPFTESLYCHGRVCRIDHFNSYRRELDRNSVFGIAVKFTIIDNVTQKLINHFIEEYFASSPRGERRNYNEKF